MKSKMGQREYFGLLCTRLELAGVQPMIITLNA
jgi:hypothetical protein